jgi:Cu-processing system permease protein
MRIRIVTLFARREIRASIRARWFAVGAISLGLLATAATQLGIATAERWGVSALDRTAATLLNLVLLFIPLLTLPLGAGSFAGEVEDGTLAYLVAQPVTRLEVFTGKLVGLMGATTLSTLFGFGAAAIAVGLRGAVPTTTYLALVAGAWLLGLVTVTIGALLSIATKRRVRALAAAIAVWIVLVFLCDFGVLAVAASQSVGPGALFAISVVNPMQAVKTLAALVISERLEILGPVGVFAVHTLGRLPLACLLAAAALLWIPLSAGIGYAIFRKESLT